MSEPTNTSAPAQDKPQDVLDIEKAYNDVESYIKTTLEGKWDGKYCLNVAGLLNFLNGAITQIRGQHAAHPWVKEQAEKQAAQAPQAPEARQE